MKENICIYPKVLNMLIEKSAKASRAIVATNILTIPEGVIHLPPIRTTSGDAIQIILIHEQVICRNLSSLRDKGYSPTEDVGGFLSVLNILHKAFGRGYSIPAEIFHSDATGVLEPDQLGVWFEHFLRLGDYAEFLSSSSVFRGTLVECVFGLPIIESYAEFHIANQLVYLTTSWMTCICVGSIASVYQAFQAVMYSPSQTACLRVPPISDATRDVDLALHFGPKVSEELADWLEERRA